MNIIEQIKAEIERLKATNPSEYAYQNAEGYIWALDDVLSFLSTLESEKPMSQEELEEEINRTYHDGSVADTSDMDHVTYENIAEYFYELGCRRTAEKYDEIEYNRQREEGRVLPGFEDESKGIPGKDFVPVDWVETLEMYGKWKIVKV